jgi:hypothetical protein
MLSAPNRDRRRCALVFPAALAVALRTRELCRQRLSDGVQDCRPESDGEIVHLDRLVRPVRIWHHGVDLPNCATDPKDNK